MFAMVMDNLVPSRTAITKANVDSGRGYKKDLFMKGEKTIKLSKLGENLTNLVKFLLRSRTTRSHQGQLSQKVKVDSGRGYM